MTKPIRIIHCGTGVAGSQALRAIIEQDGLELAGLLVHSETNEGKDAGMFARVGDTGILSTRDFHSLVNTDADAVLYMLLRPNLDHMCAFLESGKNVVTTAGFFFPQYNNKEAHDRLTAACNKGNSSFYSTGLNPGLVDDILPLALSRACMSWENIYIAEYSWLGNYPSPEMMFNYMGFGRTLDEVEQGMVRDMPNMTELFSGSCASLAHELGVEIDEVTEERHFVLAKEDLHVRAGIVKKGTIAGQRWRWAGRSKGVDRIIQETFWIIAYDLGEGMPETGSMDGSKWIIRIEGQPSVRVKFEIFRSYADPTKRGYPASGAATGMSALNAIPDVIAAKPGIVTTTDLPHAKMRNSNYGSGQAH